MTPSQVIFLDSRTDDLDRLLQERQPDTHYRVIDSGESGLGVITETLAQFESGDLAEVHIVGEGEAGKLLLGDEFVTAELLAAARSELEGWGEALTEDADILLYSCYTAAGADGEHFLKLLAEATGADVAASSDVTGSANYGGDWDLEVKLGAIEARTPFSAATLAAWEGKLLTRTVKNLDDMGADSLRERIGAAVAGDEIVFDLDTGVTGDTINLATAIAWTADNLTIDGTILSAGGGSTITIDGSAASRVFTANANTVTIRDITIQNGSVTGKGGGILHSGAGGTLKLENTTLSGSTASQSGGNIYSNGSVELTNSSVSGGVSNFKGGGLYAKGIVELTNSTIADGSATNDGGGIYADGDVKLLGGSTVSGNTGAEGGGIYSIGNVELTDSMVSGNEATSGNGGGINAQGHVTLTNSTVLGNKSLYRGAGIFSDSATVLTDSTVSGNTASSQKGGGIYGSGDITISRSTISANSTSSLGGGIYAKAKLSLLNSTVSGNLANSRGGGLYIRNDAAHEINNTTIANNVATNRGGGVYSKAANIAIDNSIVIGNTGTNPDVDGTVTSNNANIIGDATGATGFAAAETGFTAAAAVINTTLANNGGTTQTHALVGSSPALDKSGIGAVATDQRGAAAFGTRDIGAYEALPEITVLQDTTSITDGGSIAFSATQGSNTTITVTIRNDGIATLGLIAPISLTGDSAFSIASTSFETTSLDTGVTTTFSITLDATAAGSFTGAIAFGNNDPDEATYNIELTAEVAADPDAIDDTTATPTAPDTTAPTPGSSSVDFSGLLAVALGGTAANTATDAANANTEDTTSETITACELLESPPPFPSVAADRVEAGGDTDDFLLGSELADYLAGFGGNDIAIGLDAGDRLEGDDGNDTIAGNLGADWISGGLGRDLILAGRDGDGVAGGGGGDTIAGELGGDRLDGEAGNDLIFGNTGADYLSGGAGNDELRGGKDGDGITGGDGADLVVGELGADCLHGDAGDDLLFGNVEDDVLKGDVGNDSLFGGQGNDTLDGGAGDDLLWGDLGADTLTGGAGDDIFVLNAGDGSETIVDFQLGDRLGLADGLTVAQLAIAQQDSSNTVVRLDSEILAILTNVNAAALSAEFFVGL